MTRSTRMALAIAAIASVLPAAAVAQDEMTMEILNNGKPVANVEVVDLLNQTKPVGTTGSDGQVTLDTNLLDFGQGETVGVWVKECADGKVQIVLAREGSGDPCADEEAEAGDRCDCRRIGVFVWGGGPVSIDAARGTVTQSPPSAASTWTDFTFGAALDLRQMLNLEDVVLQVPDATDTSATSWAPGIQLLTDWNLTPWFSVGLDASYATMETEARFPAGVQTGDLDYYEVGGNAKLGFRSRQPIRPYATLGFSRAWNKGDFALDGETDHRVHKTGRGGIGAGLDWYPRSNVGVRLEATYSSTFDDDDADEHVRWKFGLLYRPFTTVRGGF